MNITSKANKQRCVDYILEYEDDAIAIFTKNGDDACKALNNCTDKEKAILLIKEDEGSDVANAIKKKGDEAVNTLMETEPEKRAEKAKELARNVCFVAGTMISTNEGYIPIEEINVGMDVLAMDTITNDISAKTVTRVFENQTDELVKIHVNGEQITATPSHPFYIYNVGWVAASDLRAGDRLCKVNGEYAVVEWIEHQILENPITVYNFEVEDYHTYFVGNDAVLVHNSCGNIKSIVGGTGYNSFDELKTALGPAGNNKAWHHIVEQNQINKSGFDPKSVHNTKNIVAIESGFSDSIHSKISAYYNSKQPFTNGQIVRSWLAGQDFDAQFEFGKKVLESYGTLTPTNSGWVFKAF